FPHKNTSCPNLTEALDESIILKFLDVINSAAQNLIAFDPISIEATDKGNDICFFNSLTSTLKLIKDYYIFRKIIDSKFYKFVLDNILF
ncbi:hypothetical protein KAZ01_04015, partial [Candidatus Gracilibacteria bacterium]|nr:hypothetical protein [Candidatus Gracilibacteria bacterium]